MPSDWPARYAWVVQTRETHGKCTGENTYARYIVFRLKENHARSRVGCLEGVWEGFGI